jgi:hypothetical protein
VLNNLKIKFTLTGEDLEYIKKYQDVYKRVLQEAKKEKEKETMIGRSQRHVTKQKTCGS